MNAINGEWRIVGHDDANTLEIHDDLGAFCSCSKEQAPLIAAAPEMLEALKEAKRLLDIVWEFDGDVFRKSHNDAVDFNLTLDELITRATQP